MSSTKWFMHDFGAGLRPVFSGFLCARLLKIILGFGPRFEIRVSVLNSKI